MRFQRMWWSSVILLSSGMLFAKEGGPEGEGNASSISNSCLMLEVRTQKVGVTPNTPQWWSVSLTIDGMPARSVSQQAVQALFHFKDGDRDGRLGMEECSALPTPFGLRQMMWGNLLPAIVDKPKDWDEDHDGALSLKEFAKLYAELGAGMPAVSYGRFPNTERLDAGLLSAMGLEVGQSIDVASLSDAVDLLWTRDLNRDDLIQPQELVLQMSFPGTTATHLLELQQSGERLRACLPPMECLEGDDREPVEGPFNTATANYSGQTLKLLELQVLDGEVQLHEPLTPGLASDSKGAQSVVWQHGSDLHARFHTVQSAKTLDLMAATASQFNEYQDWHELAIAGRPANGVGQPSGTVQRIVQLVDVNRDGAIALREFEEWRTVLSQIHNVQWMLAIVDLGPSLFAALDQNFDGALDRRELQQCGAMFGSLGILEAKRIELGSLPLQLRGVVSHGRPDSLLDNRPSAGPRWFQAMDRNRDGTLSRREFLGEMAQFEKLDRDGDGSLTLQDQLP
ncbi:CREC-EF hand family protein [Aureliella helgolandensis]|uniref:EF hand n=1 Tax=Aureliella helgolandensis TaxID=2527968 RepID=A0A518GHB3_9BACT|nr:hypothetical protein [Aureliella helgolandensis]QDV27985.1 EF hand [Aureliella helgolandensis]